MKRIYVFADWEEMVSPQEMGILRVEAIRGKEVFSFTYNSDWLQSSHAQVLDPDLKLFSGAQYPTNDKSNFGLFLDSSPDQWGRTLMNRREAILSRRAERKRRSLQESDYLLGVNDETRMGGIRFCEEIGGPFLANDPELKAPPFTSIRALEQASLNLENDDFYKDADALKWLKMLMAPGSSLGGARPKASVRDPKGELWIAKFPSKNDSEDAGAWEYLVNQLAKEVGIQVAETQCGKFSQRQHSFLSKRFDRTKNGKRIHFASAMTLLGYKDGFDHTEGGSYLELIELIERYGTAPNEDIRELWRRIVFSVMISNTDDHLRNHGFLLKAKGWQLSPAYDLNPNPDGGGLSLNISEDDNSLSIDLCLEVAPIFRWKVEAAKSFIQKSHLLIASWRTKAKKLGISHAEQIRMESAFFSPEV